MSDPQQESMKRVREEAWQGAMDGVYKAKNILPDQISKAGYDNLMRHCYTIERHLRMLRPREEE